MRQPAIHITGVLKSRINRLAHARAQRYALDETARLTRELLELSSNGADLDALHARLDAIEASQRDGAAGLPTAR
jgi:hypothetical protein